MKAITLLFCLYSSILAAQIPEKEISAATLDYVLQRGSICKYIKSYTESGRTIHVFASRKDPRNTNAVYITGKNIIWRVEKDISGINKGRWRNSVSDEILTYSIQGDKLTLFVRYSDNSSDNAIYSIKKLQTLIK
jgi:hypothetical protein